MLSALLIGPQDKVVQEFTEKLAWLKDFSICQHSHQYPPPSDLMAMLDRFNPDVLVINLADYGRASRMISRLIALRPVPTIALNTYCDLRLLMELMQLGVRELWFPPFDLEQIRQAVGRLSQRTAGSPGPGGPFSGEVIAFLPARGGCGATTIAIHTTAALQKLKRSVLLADFDFHNSVISFWMKVNPRHGLQEALERAHWLDAAQWKSMISCVGEIELLTAPQDSVPQIFSGDETSAVLEFTRKNYQFVLIDLPDAIYSSCWEVLEQANRILLVATPEMGSLYLARRKVAQVADHGIPRDRIHILLNRTSPNDLQPEEVEKFLSLPVVAHFGNHYRAVTSAFASATFVPEGSKLGSQFLRFAESLAGIPEPKEIKTPSKLRQIFSPA